MKTEVFAIAEKCFKAKTSLDEADIFRLRP
jgi:hypothetical protein